MATPITRSIRQVIFDGFVSELLKVEAIQGSAFDFPILENIREARLPYAWVYPLPESFSDDEDQSTGMVHSILNVGLEVVYRFEESDQHTILAKGERILADVQKQLHTYQNDSTRTWQGIITESQNDIQHLPLDDGPYGIVVMVWTVEHFRARLDPDTQAVTN